MKVQRFVLCVALLVTVGASAAELTFFDEVLRNATREQMRAAVERSNGQLVSSDGDVDRFSVEKIGLEGARVLEVAFIDGKFVLAKYTLKLSHPRLEDFRTMLFAKYGAQPVREKQRWEFDRDMQVVFYKPFLGDECYLTYVHRGRLASLEARSKATDKRRAQQRAASSNGLF